MAMILVVDDEQPVVDLLTDILEDQGHTVQTAYHGRAALSLARAARPISLSAT